MGTTYYPFYTEEKINAEKGLVKLPSQKTANQDVTMPTLDKVDVLNNSFSFHFSSSLPPSQEKIISSKQLLKQYKLLLQIFITV